MTEQNNHNNNNNNDNNNNNNNDNGTDNDNSPIQQRTLFEVVLDYVTTPIRNQQQQQPICNQPTLLFNDPEPTEPIEEANEDVLCARTVEIQ
jgi:hypothetical protein